MGKYWSIEPLWNTNATYCIAIGQRSNGKTYGCLKKALELFAETGKQTAIIRRWQDDFKGKRGASLFSPLDKDGVISDLFEDEYNAVVFKNMQWFLANIQEDGTTLVCTKPFAFAFALTSAEHDKSSSYPDVQLIIFDEFLTRGYELPNEFLLFQNTISTIVRDRDDVRIILLGNTVNQYSVYFDEMGLYNIREQVQGTIDVYKYGHSELTVAVEYCDDVNKNKKSNKYFAFKNPELEMITEGKWEIAVYPRIPTKYTNPKLTFVITFKGQMVQGDVVRIEDAIVICFHKKSTDIKPKTIVFDPLCNNTNRYYISNIFLSDMGKVGKIRQLIYDKKVFYDSNYTGEIVRNWLIQQRNDSAYIKA